MKRVKQPQDYYGEWIKHRKNVTSQHGEDGIIEAILTAIGHKGKGWCCEFGAWDGKHLSNTYHLIRHLGWSGLLIESDPEKFKDLKKLWFKMPDRIFTLNETVHYLKSEGMFLDDLLKKCPISRSFEVLSIDVDGPDFHIWKSLRDYRPKIVVIEHSGCDANIIQREGAIHKKDRDGSTDFWPMKQLGESKGYKLLVDTGNLIFLDEEYVFLL